MAVAFLDFETRGIFQDNDPFDQCCRISVGIVQMWDCRAKIFHEPQSYKDEDVRLLVKDLLRADAIVVYNAYFDIEQVLGQYYQGIRHEISRLEMERIRVRVFDPMAYAHLACGYWPKLDAIAVATLGEDNSKSTDGIQAVQMWRKDQIEALTSYCAQDVAVLRKLCTEHESVQIPPLPDTYGTSDPSIAAWKSFGGGSRSTTFPLSKLLNNFVALRLAPGACK